jgi:hypothetical protein
MGLNWKDTQFLIDATQDKLAERYSRAIIDVLCRDEAPPDSVASELRALSEKFTRRIDKLNAAVQVLNQQEEQEAASNE